jgi:hypothetical protein
MASWNHDSKERLELLCEDSDWACVLLWIIEGCWLLLVVAACSILAKMLLSIYQ